MSYRFTDSLRAGLRCSRVPSWSYSQAVRKLVRHITLLYVKWKIPDDGQKNCPKHVEFYSKNKFEKLVHLVGFIIRSLTRCTVTWTSNYSKYEFFEDLVPLQISVGLPFFKYRTFCIPDARKTEVTTHLLDLQFNGVPAEFH